MWQAVMLPGPLSSICLVYNGKALVRMSYNVCAVPNQALNHIVSSDGPHALP